jgi:hypothetical protein
MYGTAYNANPPSGFGAQSFAAGPTALNRGTTVNPVGTGYGGYQQPQFPG